MRRRTLRESANAVSGTLRPPDALAEALSVVVDSRSAGPGALFFALRGERTDGHRFAGQALAAGAAAAVVERGRASATDRGALIEVEDTGRALMDIAASERASSKVRVVGVTGSSGKTSTKDLTAAVLAARLRVAASPASFNNEVGLPLTILGAADGTEAMVLEMGARGTGHIRRLCDVAAPEIGIVTNVGRAHLGLFGSAEAIVRAKAELPEALPPAGTAILNADDPVVAGYAARTAAGVILYGTVPDADVRAEEISVDAETGRARFVLITPAGSTRVRLAIAGRHMVWNALAAAAAGLALGVGPDAAAAALETARVSPGRMELRRAAEGWRVLDDSYNANPASMAAALATASRLAREGLFIAVLGEMAELGPIAEAEHRALGRRVAAAGADRLITVGPPGRTIAEGALEAGMPPDRITVCDGVEAAAARALRLVRSGDLVLVKGSRAVGLDRVAAALAEPAAAGLGVSRERAGA